MSFVRVGADEHIRVSVGSQATTQGPIVFPPPTKAYNAYPVVVGKRVGTLPVQLTERFIGLGLALDISHARVGADEHQRVSTQPQQALTSEYVPSGSSSIQVGKRVGTFPIKIKC